MLLLVLVSVASGANILVFNPTIGHSHVQFLGNLAEIFAEDGHNVTVLSPIWDEAVELHGTSNKNITKIAFRSPYLTLDFWSKLEVKSTSFWDLPESYGLTLTAEEFRVFFDAYELTYKSLLEDEQLMLQLKDSNFQLGVVEYFELGALGFFEILDIKTTICASSVGLIGFHYNIAHFPFFTSFVPGYLTTFGVEMTFWERYQNWRIERDLVKDYEPWINRLHTLFKQYKPDILDLYELMERRTGVVLSNANEFTETPRPSTNLFQYIGGINVHPPKSLDIGADALLNLRPSTVLFSFGTYIKGCQMPMNLKLELLEAFGTFPNVTFLWKYEDCQDDTPFEKYSNVIPKPWWPQSDLLGDNRLKAFITHGGMNSMTEVAFRGKPAIVVPLIGDQYINAKTSGSVGNSITVHRTKLSKNTMITALQEVLTEDSEIVKKAKMTAAVLEGKSEDYKRETLRWVRLLTEFGPMEHHRLPTKHLSLYMDERISQKLTSIVCRGLCEKPESIDFQFLDDIKSFWSQTARATLHWAGNKDLNELDCEGKKKYPSKLFIKLPFISANASDIENDECDSDLERDLKILWNTEVEFYEVFGRTNLGLFKIPKVYLTEYRHSLDDGFFVLEDMSATDGFVFSEEYIPGFSLDQVKKIATGLADLHYHNITSLDGSWLKRCDVPVDVIDNFCSIEFQWGVVSKLKTYGLGEKIDQIAGHYTKEFTYEGRHGYKAKGLPPVTVHQDLNATNILWTNKSGSKEISAFIDFQMSTVGGICEDLIRVLCLGMSADDRRKYTDSVLREYHGRMAKLFNGSPPFTFEQVQEEYCRSFPMVNNFTLFGISCYYGQCKETKMPADVKHQILSEYLSRATGIIDDIVALSH